MRYREDEAVLVNRAMISRSEQGIREDLNWTSEPDALIAGIHAELECFGNLP